MPRQPGSRLPAAPPAAAKSGSCPAKAQRGRLERRSGSRELPRAGRQDSGAAPGREPGVSGPRAAGGLCQSGTSELCPPGVLQRAAPPAGSPSREPRGARHGRTPQRSPSAARALPAGPAPRRTANAGRFPHSSSPQALTPSPFQAASTRPRPSSKYSSISSRKVQPGPSRSPLPAARAGLLPAAPAGTARPPAGRPGAGSPGPAAARDGGPGTDQGPNAAPGARHAWDPPGPLSTSRSGRGPRVRSSPKPDLGWRFGRSTLLHLLFGERAVK